MPADSTLRHRLHQALHRIPGIPDHDRARRLNGNRSARLRAVRAHAARRHTTPPRVLVGVQHAIARLLGQAG